MTVRGPCIAADLTRHQAEQLVLLLELGAQSNETAVDVYGRRGRELNPVTLVGRLAHRGLVDTRVRRAGGGQRTVYWLTAAGRRLARLLADDTGAAA